MDKAVFLSRDGVINEVQSKRVEFVNSVEDVYLLPGAAGAIKILNNLDYKVFIMTTESDTNFSYGCENVLNDIHCKLLNLLYKEAGAQIDDIAYCVNKQREISESREPKLKMILELAAKHHIDLQCCITIGENGADIAAGRLAGARTILIIDEAEIIPVIEVDNVVFSLMEAVEWIVETSPVKELSLN